MPKAASGRIYRRALRIKQDHDHPLYLFSLSSAELLKVAEISRVSRDDAGTLIGYQRPQVKRHVQDIVAYLDSGKALFPNSIILALSSGVKFRESRGPKVNDDPATSIGTLELPLASHGGRKPAWIVDGQQRAMALSLSKRRDLNVPVSAFIADETELQRDQFLRINNSKPLPRGLITELLPTISTSPLPAKLAASKIPAELCDLLNRREDSPFYGLIKRATSTASDRKTAVITDTAIIKMIQASISQPAGCLFPYRNMGTGETDFDKIWAVLVTYWTAVKNTFPEAWGKLPTKSRLMHGAGILAMGRLMDRVMGTAHPFAKDATKHVETELLCLKPICHWTSGQWDTLNGLPWDEVQNVPRHISLLSSTLIRAYLEGRSLLS